MKNQKWLLLFLIITLAEYAFTQDRGIRPEPMEILKNAEKLRAPWAGMSLNANIVTNNEVYDNHLYKVFYQDEKTLITFVEPDAERGDLLLMSGEDLWFYVHSTSRPTRITPIQRLSGATSFGDLAQLAWSKDYKIDQMSDTIYRIDNTEKETFFFTLSAKSKGATYQKIYLWIDKEDNRPIISKVYLTSGKLYKTLKFSHYEIVKGAYINTEIIFTDHFNKNTESILRFTEITEANNTPNRYFIKTMLPEVSDELSR